MGRSAEPSAAFADVFSFAVPAASWKYPSSWSTSLLPCVHWSRDVSWYSWLKPTTTQAPPPSYTAPSTGWPKQDWVCDNSGTDGKDFDWQGNKCPYSGLDFKWFGVSKGWLPSKGWWGVSVDFQFPSAFLSNCGKATWWAPSSSWKYPISLSIPGHWLSLGWKGYNWAPTTFVCNKSGNDGWEYDPNGHGRPSSYPQGWLYFGAGPLWQPRAGWSIPSKSYTPPPGWNPYQAPWWKPATYWTLPKA